MKNSFLTTFFYYDLVSFPGDLPISHTLGVFRYKISKHKALVEMNCFNALSDPKYSFVIIKGTSDCSLLRLVVVFHQSSDQDGIFDK